MSALFPSPEPVSVFVNLRKVLDKAAAEGGGSERYAGWLGEAKLFELPNDFLHGVAKAAVIQIAQDTVGDFDAYTSLPEGKERTERTADVEAALRRHAAKIAPLTTRDMPFSACWLAYETPQFMDYMTVNLRTGADEIESGSPHDFGYSLGVLVTEDEIAEAVQAWSNTTCGPVDGDVQPKGSTGDNDLFMIPIYQGGEWLRSATGMPWAIATTVRFLRDAHSTLTNVRGSLGVRRAWKKATGKKGRGEVPPDYYRISMDRLTKIEVGQRAGTGGVSPSYRHDVRSHTRLRVRRGPLPLAPDEHKKLTRMGYRIWLHHQPSGDEPGEVAHELERRGLPLRREGEWLAVKVSRVSAHVSPKDESLPYVPAVRRSKLIGTKALEGRA